VSRVDYYIQNLKNFVAEESPACFKNRHHPFRSLHPTLWGGASEITGKIFKAVGEAPPQF